jgi:hypothetical protein
MTYLSPSLKYSSKQHSTHQISSKDISIEEQDVAVIIQEWLWSRLAALQPEYSGL